jgi:hypothetical protein
MNVEKYTTKSTVSSLIYTFDSVGTKTIKKVVIYSKIEYPEYVGLPTDAEVYNLGFGDFNEETGGIDDKIESRNGDTEKVLATVANTAHEFWEEYPNALLFFRGSQSLGEKARRIRLYQMGLNKYMGEINVIVDIFGFVNDEWEEFEINKNYNAFLILRKD